MAKRILMDAAYPGGIRVALMNDQNQIEDFEYETSNKQQIKGNIYLAKIVRIEPSLQAAFIDYGFEKNGFLPFSEIHPIYYHIPSSDRDKIDAELASMNRPEITSQDIEEAKSKKFKDSSDSELFSLEGETDEDNDSEAPEQSEEENNPDQISEKKSRSYQNQYKIQDVIKKGQILLVQAQKESRGNKGASFTSHISLAGKYCVLVPNSGGHNGISRKISNAEERKRLRQIIDEILPNDEGSKASLILRTAGVRKTTYDIKRDFDYLVRLWNKIREVTLQSKAPCFIHMEDDIIKKTIRDIFTNDVKEILVQGDYAYSCASEVMHNMLPTDVHKVVKHDSKVPIFSKFGVEEQLSLLYQPIAPLASGGYIVINPTEALISIDVNSGKATAERGIEETALKTNIEAAKEISRQLKLRDLSGLIIIDFIDMYESKNRKIVERTLKEALARDKAKIQVGHISTFGLLEMSRQRLRSSFLESNTKMCNHCNGKGIVRADESNSMLILRTIEQEIFKEEKLSTVNVYAHISAVMYLLNNKRHEIKSIEEKYGITLNLYNDHDATSDSFSMEKVFSDKSSKLPQETKPALSITTNLFDADSDSTTLQAPNATPQNGNSSKQRRAKKWKKNSSSTLVQTEQNLPQEQEQEQKTEEPTQEKPRSDKKKKRQKVTNEKSSTDETPKTDEPKVENEASENRKSKSTSTRRKKNVAPTSAA